MKLGIDRDYSWVGRTGQKRVLRRFRRKLALTVYRVYQNRLVTVGDLSRKCGDSSEKKKYGSLLEKQMCNSSNDFGLKIRKIHFSLSVHFSFISYLISLIFHYWALFLWKDVFFRMSTKTTESDHGVMWYESFYAWNNFVILTNYEIFNRL